MSHLLLTSALLLSLPPGSTEIDAAVAKALDDWRVPGLALAIVRDGKIVHLKGYGLASLETKAPVSPDTIFPLASCSKPLTVTMLAMLADDGKLDWDDPVKKRLPFFRLKDPVADEKATLRDLLCHRTGVGPHQLLWYRSPLSLEQRVRRLALLEPDAEFRKEFHYQTIAFGAAGLAGERVAGKPWGELIDERLFRPLGMTSTSAAQPAGDKNLASPHRRDKNDAIRVIPRYPLTELDPAGTIHSTARDLGAFLQFQLADGTFAGKRLVSQTRIREPRQSNIVVPLDDYGKRLNPETTRLGYGLGWIVQDYRGQPMLLHGGAIDGFRAHFVLLPDAKLGIAILSNLDGSLCNFALANTLVDLFLEAPPRAWNDELLELQRLERQYDADRAERLRRKRPPNAKLPRPIADYQGEYRDEAYGDCTIALAGDGALEVRWGGIRVKLQHFEGHLFVADEPPFRDAPFEFVVSADGRVASVRFLERTFVRKAAK